MLLRTRYRKRVPKGWSYPIGSELLSSALEGVPQFADITISFFSRANTTPKGPSLEALKTASCEVLHAYHGGNRAESTMWGPHVTIYAVPSLHRATIRGLLISSRLSDIRSWFCEPLAEAALRGGWIKLVFDPAEGMRAVRSS